jgi:hypothetical protein
MPREELLALAADVDRLIEAGGHAASGDERLRRRSDTLRKLSLKVPALVQVVEAVERVLESESDEVTPKLLDLLLVVRQIRASLTSAGFEGALQPVEESGPWLPAIPTSDLIALLEELQSRAASVSRRSKPRRPLQWGPGVDVRLVEPCLRSMVDEPEAICQLVVSRQFGPQSTATEEPALPVGASQEILTALEKSEIETEEVVRAAVALLTKKDELLRARAVRLLGRMGRFTEVVVPVLADVLQRDTAYVRLSAAETLGKMGPKASAALPALLWWSQMDLGQVGEVCHQALTAIPDTSGSDESRQGHPS